MNKLSNFKKIIFAGLLATAPLASFANDIKGIKTQPSKVSKESVCYYEDRVYSIGAIKKAATGEKIKCELKSTTSDVFGPKAPQWVEVVKFNADLWK